MNRLALILGLGALVAHEAFATTAQTGNWTASCQSGQVIKTITGGAVACYTPVSGQANDSASPILSVTDCESIDVTLYTDWDGDGTACTIDWAIQGCPMGASGLSTDGKKNAACATLPSVANLSGATSVVDEQANLGATEIRIVGQAAGTNANSCRIQVKCAIGAQQ